MDDICVALDRLLSLVVAQGPPRLPFCGRPFSGYANPPAPHLLLGLLMEPDIPDLDLGDRRVAIPARHIYLHSVHSGNRTPIQHRLSAWCVFFDVGGMPEFASCRQRSLFATASATAAMPELEAAFSNLSTTCVRHGAGAQRYLGSEPMWDTNRHGCRAATATAHVTSALLELLARARDAAVPERAGNAMPYSIRRVLDHIGVHLGDPELDLPRLAQAADLSVDHFGRSFRQVMGLSPMQHLKWVRLQQAGRLLAETDLPIGTIAEMVGFLDPFHFSREFRRGMGTNPRGWRMRHQ